MNSDYMNEAMNESYFNSVTINEFFGRNKDKDDDITDTTKNIANNAKQLADTIEETRARNKQTEEKLKELTKSTNDIANLPF